MCKCRSIPNLMTHEYDASRNKCIKISLSAFTITGTRTVIAVIVCGNIKCIYIVQHVYDKYVLYNGHCWSCLVQQ